MSIPMLYLRKTDHVIPILLITFASGTAQVFASSIVVPIISIFISEPSYGNIENINRVVLQLLSQFGIQMSIYNLLLLFVGIEIFCFGLVYLQERLAYYARAKFVINIRKNLLRKILWSRWSSLLDVSSGEIASYLTLETQRASVSAFSLLDALVALGYILTFSSVFLIFYWKFVLVLLFVIGLSFYLTKSIQYKSQILGNEQTIENNSFLNTIVEFLRGIKLIKVSALENYAYNVLHKSSQRNQMVSKDIEDYQAKMNFFVNSVKSVTMVLIIFFALIVFKIEIAILALFVYIFQKIMPKINLFQVRFLFFLTSYSSLKEIEEFSKKLLFEEDVKHGRKSFGKLEKGILFKKVSFNYGNANILDDVSIEIQPKNTVGIAGSSGAGKSTLVDLLLGLHKPNRGAIYIDSVNLFDYELKTWRDRIGYVTQDDIMFNDTIWNNLVFGLESVEQEWVYHCARLANIHQFILETPQGYNTVIGEGGAKLSGGQKQRLSLARALIRRPELLILDEATSALDTESEKVIQNSISQISHKMTIVVIAHRLSTLVDSDIIYIIDNGRVVEKGTYTSLIRYDGYFSKMHKLQAAGTSL